MTNLSANTVVAKARLQGVQNLLWTAPIQLFQTSAKTKTSQAARNPKQTMRSQVFRDRRATPLNLPEKFLKDKAAPKFAKSKTENEFPRREKARSDSADPKQEKSRTDSDDPTWEIPNTEMDAATLTKLRNDKEEPICAEYKTDKEAPILPNPRNDNDAPKC